MGSDSNVRHRQPQSEGLVCPSLTWCFGVNIRHRQPQAEDLAPPSLTWCFSVARAGFWKLEGCNLELRSVA